MKLGLVFAGGGGKGAYEVGVWKYLHEIGLDKKISCVSGSSVGALNAVLMSVGDYKLAEEIWLNKIFGKIVYLNENKAEENDLFPRTGLIDLINEDVGLERVRQSKIKCYATCTNKKTKDPEYFLINSLDNQKGTLALLASSAMAIFNPIEIDGTKYTDGSNSNKFPVEPLLKEGCDKILVINIEDINFDYSKIKKQEVVEVKSVFDLGGVKSIITFNRTNVKALMQLGYSDCKYNFAEQLAYLNEELDEEKSLKISKILKLSEKQLLKETLKVIDKDETVISDLQCSLNIKTGTMGGKVFYDSICYKGWKFQIHNISGLENHVRLLDRNNHRRAWTWDKNRLLAACKNLLIDRC